MPPPRTGSLEKYRPADGRTYYRARIRLADGTRARVDVPEKYASPAGGKTAEGRAELYAQAAQEREDERGELLEAKRKRGASAKRDLNAGETCDAYHDRIVDLAREREQSDVDNKRFRWNAWIKPEIGAIAISRITRDHIETVRDKLDRAQREWLRLGRGRGRLAPKTAANVWSELTSTFAEACSSKRRELRLLERNPCAHVQPPDRGDARRKPFVFPSEFLSLVACEDVPLEWRELHSIACYLYVRPGELRVLKWTDVDLDHGIVSITKAWDYPRAAIKVPKTRNGVRRVPIEPGLMLLLEGMRERSDANDALVAPLLSNVNEDTLAQVTRSHLKTARVHRAELHEESRTTMPFGFRGWRDTGITWARIAGVDVAKIQARAGHDAITTTMGYVKSAEALHAGFGTPFPELPRSLVWPKDWAKRPTASQGIEKSWLFRAREGSRTLMPFGGGT